MVVNLDKTWDACARARAGRVDVELYPCRFSEELQGSPKYTMEMEATQHVCVH